MNSTIIGPDGKSRCQWCSSDDEYRAYHDNEWGYPVSNDQRLFEKICLEGFQSGLSWRTILNKREGFRKAFEQFDFNKVAEFTGNDVDRLLQDASIVRHRGKIEATINNAGKAKEMVQKEGSLAAFFWGFEPQQSSKSEENVSVSKESIALSKELKKRGWKFVGPTTAYAFMQAMGLVNDHAKNCEFRDKAIVARREFVKPG